MGSVPILCARSKSANMKRICVIDISGLSLGLLAGAEGLWIDSLSSPLRPMTSTLPAVQASLHASMTTGCEPGLHGIVAGGVYRRQSGAMSFAERSNTLLSKKRFWHSRKLTPAPKVSLVFWSNPLAGGADVVLGASTYSCRCGGVSAQPRGLYDSLTAEFGQFDVSSFHGPTASFGAGDWISQAAREIWRKHNPDLQWVYLPGVGTEIVRGGTGSPVVIDALRTVDAYAMRIAECVAESGGEVVIVSSGGYVDVTRAVAPNAALAAAGLLKTVKTDAGDVLDTAGSRAFAMVDHQFAHLYCADDESACEATAVLAGLDGVDAVLPREEVFCEGLGRDRAGEYVIIAARDAWFAYRWWADGQTPPAMAYETGDLCNSSHSPNSEKCGYDPCELFAGAEPGKIAYDESLVRASKGRADAPTESACVLGSTCNLQCEDDVSVTDLPKILRELMY